MSEKGTESTVVGTTSPTGWVVAHDGAVSRPKMTETAAILARVEALVEKWNSTPDYSPTDYDRGRVDQRHDMTGELYEALTP